MRRISKDKAKLFILSKKHTESHECNANMKYLMKFFFEIWKPKTFYIIDFLWNDHC